MVRRRLWIGNLNGFAGFNLDFGFDCGIRMVRTAIVDWQSERIRGI
jgi:hypothetical protein